MSRLPMTRVESMVDCGNSLVDVAALWADEGMPRMDPPCTANAARAAAAVDAFVAALPQDKELGFATVFSPFVVDACCARGVVPMAIKLEAEDSNWDLSNMWFFAPRVHHERHLIDLAAFRAGRTIARKAKQYTITVDNDIDVVFDALARRHGAGSWLCPLLQDQLRYMHAHPNSFRTKIVTICLWKVGANGERVLAACELGYAVGKVYTSMTGAAEASGAGNVQLAALGGVLRESGFEHWDLGCTMEYKTRLGARVVERAEWMRMVKAQVGAAPALVLADGSHEMPCAVALRCVVTPADVLPAACPAREAKLQRKAAKRARAAAWRAANPLDLVSVVSSPALSAVAESEDSDIDTCPDDEEVPAMPSFDSVSVAC